MADQLLTAAMEDRMTWKPISSAPKCHDILAYGQYKPYHGSDEFVGWFITGWDPDVQQWLVLGHDDVGCFIYANPTHWMPLPEPPKETDDGR